MFGEDAEFRGGEEVVGCGRCWEADYEDGEGEGEEGGEGAGGVPGSGEEAVWVACVGEVVGFVVAGGGVGARVVGVGVDCHA